MFSSKVFASVLLCSLFLKCASERDIFVSPGGNDSSNCSASFKCKTLDRALGLARGLNSTKILLSKGNYSLNTSHSFTKIASFGLFGNTSYDHDDQISCQITCEPNVSLSFTFSENISFEGVKFRKCGGWHQSSAELHEQYPYLKGAKFKTALDFRYCRNLRISNVEICSSPGLGANLYDVGGVVNLTNSLFADNYALNESSYDRWIFISQDGSYVYSGGGVNLMLNQYSHNTWNVTPGEHDSYQHNNIYEFSNCHFMRNRAMWLNDTKDDNGMNTLKLPFNRGGGLAMYFQGNASGCHIKIQSCVFANNKASWGGGFQVEMKDKTENNSLEVRATVFRENFASFAGGGARLGSLPEKHVQLRINRFEMTNCSFVNNSARLGGGASLYGATIPRMYTNHTDPVVVTQFFFKNDSSWIGNIGTVGAAVSAFLINRNEDLIGPEIPYRVRFENIVFRSNKVVPLHHNLIIGQGTFYSQQVPLTFQGNVQFVNNTQSALVLDGSIVEVIDRLDFLNNTGVRGGAIAMYGRSRILLYENTSILTFEGNNCEDKGGALYIQAPGPPLVSFNATGADNQVCFFGYSNPAKDYDEWNTTVIFKNNSASLGTSVFATTLQYCRRPGENRQRNNVLKWKFIKFDDLPSNSNTSLLGKVVTEPVNITTDKKEWEVAPGEHFDATVKLSDEVENVVPGIVNVNIESAHSVKLLNPSRSLFLSTEGRITNITLRGENGGIFDVKLNCIGSQLLKKQIHNVTLKNCYAGFYYCSETSSCKCMSRTNTSSAKGISHCEKGKSVYIKEGYWAGTVAGNFVTYLCPPQYCKNSRVYKYSEGHVCSDSRKPDSILCGQCKQNYTITFGSELCFISCSYWHLLYLLPIGFGFLLVVVIVMLVDLDFFTGYLNAWLYSYQIMDLLTPDGFRFDPFIEFITAFTNVHIEIGGRSFCLATGLDDADKLMLMYGIPFYVLIVVAILTWLVGRYPRWCFSRKVLRSSPSAPFRAVCTILVFCYTDITRVSLLILSPAHVGSKTVLYFYGNLDFFHKKHIAYGIVAILWIVIFVLPFPLILLFRPYLTRGLRPVLNLNRWGPFFDAFQSCFKNKYRWCASFYFLCRLGILLMHTYIPSGSVKRVVLEGACILILVIFAYLRPYKEARDVMLNQGESSYEWIYKSDVALLTTLALITVISSKIDCSCFTTKDGKKGLKVAVCVLAYVPLIVLLVLGYRVLRRHCPAIDIGNCVTEEEARTPVVTETSDSACSGRRGTSEPTTSRENSLARSTRTETPENTQNTHS